MNSFLRNRCALSRRAWAATLGLAILLLASPRPVRAQSEFMVLNWPTLPPAFVGYEYSVPLWAYGGVEPYTWELAGGTLPAGLAIEQNGSIRSRTDLKPTQSGLFSFTVQVRDSGGRVASRDFVLRIFNTGAQPLAVLTHDLGIGTPGQPIEEYLDALGGSPPYTWSLSGGQLPPGVRLESAGRIVGTPVETGEYKSYAFQVTATDTAGATAMAPLVMTITPSSEVAVATPSRIRGLQGLFLIMNGSLGASPLRVSGGTGPYQWLKLLGNLPPELTLNADGSITGTPNTLGSFTFLIAVLDSQRISVGGFSRCWCCRPIESTPPAWQGARLEQPTISRSVSQEGYRRMFSGPSTRTRRSFCRTTRRRRVWRWTPGRAASREPLPAVGDSSLSCGYGTIRRFGMTVRTCPGGSR